ncbi:unnamed protein product, partial [Ectocarpus sp. 6 AP-2014]
MPPWTAALRCLTDILACAAVPWADLEVLWFWFHLLSGTTVDYYQPQDRGCHGHIGYLGYQASNDTTTTTSL